MTKKSFFKERTSAEIKKLSISRTSRQKGLVERIFNLNPVEEALEIRTKIIPGRFFINTKTGAQASRKALKHGQSILLPHPATWTDCYNSPEIPLSMRAKAFAQLEEMKEEEINFVSYHTRPTWGDRTRRIFPFAHLLEGLRIFAYAENKVGEIKVEPYTEAKRVKRNGGSFVVDVPSRERKRQRYQFRLDHIPTIRAQENLATILLLRPSIIVDEESREPKVGRTPHQTYLIKYGWGTSNTRDDVITLYPHDEAAYLGIVKQSIAKHNLTPMEMNPFALFSKTGVEFYKKLCNNTLIFDPTLTTKDKLRKPHLAEKSIFLARAIGQFGHDEISYWDPGRDGKIKDYDWSIQE